MNAEIICVGTELLLGDIINTNASFISKELSKIGIDIFHHVVVGDNKNRLKDTIIQAFSRADLVITTGGLGPTFDDISKDIVAEYFEKELVYDQKAIKTIEHLFTSLNREMTDNNLRQALVIDGCTVLDNDNGFAPGMFFEKNGKTVVMLPGPPNEMKPMVLNKLLPILSKDTSDMLLSKNVHIFGVGESKVESVLHDLMVSSNNPTIAPYAKQGEMYVRVTAKDESKDKCLKLIDPIVDRIKSIFKENVYGVDCESLQAELVEKLIQNKKTIAVAESCTGGLLGAKLTEIMGASTVFLGGVISYSNIIKINNLGVDQQTIIDFGAVSKQTASEMASNIRQKTGADIGIGITGIAGPSGGTEEKPVGLVYIGIDYCGKTQTFKQTLSRGRGNERNFIRNYATSHAMFLALTMLNEKK
jgi:nicotinamide-nucleotide amidase